jgi:UDP-N-acetylmuramyl pentapeptide phosphotransferase/UDP-N-acetylglucosamine-1-phosphate transferase
MSAATTLLLIAWMLKHPSTKLILDHPNPRSLHSAPVPRTGGVAVMLGVFVGALVLLPEWEWAILIASVLALISFLDDRHELPIVIRFAAHLLAAAIFVATVLPNLPVFAQIIGAIAIVWMTNLYNFMDGSDGLAGGMALIGFGAYAVAASFQGEPEFALLSACVAAAAAAFLVFNFHPAKIFLGDAGSIPLGFLAAAFGLTGWSRGWWPLWFPLVVFSPFIIDASVTLLKRLARGEKVWQAHHSHYYQRLVRMGWGHRRTAIAEYGIMLCATASALWAAIEFDTAAQTALLVAWLCLYGIIMMLIDYRWSRR